MPGRTGRCARSNCDRDRVVLRRAVRGMRMKVRVPVAAFRGVALRMLAPHGADGPRPSPCMLDHPDCGLVGAAVHRHGRRRRRRVWKCLGPRARLCRCWCAKPTATLREPFRRLGSLAIGAPTPRRRRRSAHQAAPAFDPDAPETGTAVHRRRRSIAASAKSSRAIKITPLAARRL